MPDEKYGDEGFLWNAINERIREIVREEMQVIRAAQSAADPPLAAPDEGIIKGFGMNPKLFRKKR